MISERAKIGILVLSLLAGPLPAAAQGSISGELVDRTELRYTRTPASLPFSNQQGEGYENKIAELMASRLGIGLTYSWYPNALGFVRNTLRADKCDLIMGVVAADELVQNSNPYYRSTYVLVYRTADADRFADIDSPLMKLARIGVVASTPVVDLLARKGLTGQIHGYELMVDSRVEQPARQAIEDLANGQIDAALLWGPLAAYWAKRQSVPLSIAPIKADRRTGPRLDFRISMGLRPNEPEWKHRVNELIRELQPEIQAILIDYGVPLLDERGNLIAPGPSTAVPTSTVPEPAGYRMDKYRAPVPATLAGATVVSTIGSGKVDRRATAGSGRRLPQAAQAREPRPESALGRAEAPAYRRLGLVAQCRLRRAVTGLHRLFP